MIRPENRPVWRGMTRAELDAAYNNTAAVPDSAARLADWTERSAVLRARQPALLDRRYGPWERNRIDLFRCGAVGAPLFAFIHGGYWQRNAKEMFAFVAEGPLAFGFDVALIGYTLAPEASLREIVAEVAEAIRWLRRDEPPSGIGTGKLIVSGWSAGGHLTATAMGMAEVDGGLAISGVYDVEPCRLNYLNEKLRLTAADAEAMSPVRHLPARAGPLVVAYGRRELPELQRQSADFAAAWGGSGLPGHVLALAGHDHFSIMEELGRPDGALANALSKLLT